MAIKYKDMEWAEGASQLPGIRRKIFYIPKRDIVAWPTLPADFVTKMGELVTYVGSYTLAAQAKFKTLTAVIEKSPVDGKSQGVKPSKTFMNQVVIQHEGVDEDASAFAMQANNDDLVILIQTKGGKYRVIGHEIFETNCEVEQNIGGTPTDEMYTKVTATCTDIAPGLFYDGEIVTESGTINPQS
jgi:hypothetical protein